MISVDTIGGQENIVRWVCWENTKEAEVHSSLRIQHQDTSTSRRGVCELIESFKSDFASVGWIVEPSVWPSVWHDNDRAIFLGYKNMTGQVKIITAQSTTATKETMSQTGISESSACSLARDNSHIPLGERPNNWKKITRASTEISDLAYWSSRVDRKCDNFLIRFTAVDETRIHIYELEIRPTGQTINVAALCQEA